MQFCPPSLQWLHSSHSSLVRFVCGCVCGGVFMAMCVCGECVRGRVWGGCVCVCVCLAYTSEDFHMKTPRHTEDSTPSEDPKTGPRKTLAKNAENVMFYHLRGFRAPRTSMDFQPYLIYEDIRVLGRISKASRCVCILFCFSAANTGFFYRAVQNTNMGHIVFPIYKKLIPRNISSISSVQTHDGFSSNDKETADQFNWYFTSIDNNLAAKFKCNDDVSEDNDNVNYCKNDTDIKSVHFEFDVITSDFVFDQICNFSNNKNTGVDNMCTRLLKLAAPIICHPLAYICNLSLFTSKLPSRWKVAKVTPIYKDGDKSDVNN